MLTKKETWERLREFGTVKGERTFREWNLKGVDLICADLSGADLSHADLSNSKLGNANLSHAKLTSANLSGADLRYTNLFGAGLAHVNFYNANVKGAIFSGANLFGAHLEGVDLEGANLSNSNLEGVDLQGANLQGANLRGADLFSANLNRANLNGADLSYATFYIAVLHCATLRDTEMTNVNFNSADLSGADITGSMFWGASTTDWKIDGIKAEYLYITRDKENRDKCMRSFKEGQFETLFKSMPTIELIFEGGISPIELLKLNALIEELNQENPGLGLKMARMSTGAFATHVDIHMTEAEKLEDALQIIKEGLKKAEDQGVSVRSIMPEIYKLLPYHDTKDALSSLQDRKVEINLYSNCTVLLNKGDGTYSQAVGNGAEVRNITCDITQTYESNREEIGDILNAFRDSLRELEESIRESLNKSTDLLIQALEAKETGSAQKIWNEIKEGVKTAGAVGGITSAVVNLSKYFG